MTATRLPPSWRDFEVYRTVIVGGKSTREAAEECRLSQTRVCQIVERMRAWQAEVLPTECPLPEEGLLRLSQNIACERIDSLYGEAAAWRRSQGETTQTRTSGYGDEFVTTKLSCGDPKYLLAASRLVRAGAEIGRHGGLALPEEQEEERGAAAGATPTPRGRAEPLKPEAQAKEHTGRPEARPTAHPIEDCSRNGQSHPIPATAAPANAAPTAEDERTSSALSPEQALARRRLLAPVQHDHAAAIASSNGGTQIQLTPNQPGLRTTPLLTRQQRRKLQRAMRAG